MKWIGGMTLGLLLSANIVVTGRAQSAPPAQDPTLEQTRRQLQAQGMSEQQIEEALNRIKAARARREMPPTPRVPGAPVPRPPGEPVPSAPPVASKAEPAVEVGALVLVYDEEDKLWYPALIVAIRKAAGRYRVKYFDASAPDEDLARADFRVAHLTNGVAVKVYGGENKLLDAVIVEAKGTNFTVKAGRETEEVPIDDIVVPPEPKPAAAPAK
ncbi:MAG: hypothetical protein JXR37_10060 [Kiritimatiellae bacterium]|nr:hypothetical protein [Kiritimatiellia bacterium]